ncbi:MAG: hypothetical protein AAF928_16550 [Myxococcota bacterium]
MAELLVIDGGADLPAKALVVARTALAADALVATVADQLTVGAFVLTVTHHHGVWMGQDPDDLTPEERTRRRADVRQHDHLSVSALESGRTELLYAAGIVADAVGGSVYDPRRDEWLTVDRRTSRELRDKIEERAAVALS